MFIIVFLLTIIILVVIHELGHFFAAIFFKIKVLEFGFGIPPRFWGKKIGETLISLNWLPFGGFVRLLGEDDVDEKVLKDKRSFASQTVGKRIIVVIAGVLMNLILAWVLFYIVLISQNFKIVYPALEPSLVIDKVQSGFPADQAGLKPGDKIALIDGKKMSDITSAVNYITTKKDTNPINLVITDIDDNNSHQVTILPKQVSLNQKRIGVSFSQIGRAHV